MPASRPLRIAWLGGGPAESGGAPGVVTELLDGLTRRGHEIDCFLPGAPRSIPEHLRDRENLKFIAGTSSWRFDRWYSRTRRSPRSLRGCWPARWVSCDCAVKSSSATSSNHTTSFTRISRSSHSARRQASLRSIPLAVRPDSHQAGELRWLIRERRLAFRSQPAYTFFIVAAIMSVRTLVQALRIRRVDLLIAISTRVSRSHRPRLPLPAREDHRDHQPAPPRAISQL